MRLFAPSLAFVDLETTGTRAAADRVTEVGIVRVDADPAGGPPSVVEWSSLVDPGVPIPSPIQALTGITDAMVRGAPTFSALAGGGMVVAEVDGKMQLKRIKLDPSVVNANDVEMLEDLIVVAVAEAQKKAAEAMQMELQKVTGGIDLPFKLPF